MLQFWGNSNSKIHLWLCYSKFMHKMLILFPELFCCNGNYDTGCPFNFRKFTCHRDKHSFNFIVTHVLGEQSRVCIRMLQLALSHYQAVIPVPCGKSHVAGNNSAHGQAQCSRSIGRRELIRIVIRAVGWTLISETLKRSRGIHCCLCNPAIHSVKVILNGGCCF